MFSLMRVRVHQRAREHQPPGLQRLRIVRARVSSPRVQVLCTSLVAQKAVTPNQRKKITNCDKKKRVSRQNNHDLRQQQKNPFGGKNKITIRDIRKLALSHFFGKNKNKNVIVCHESRHRLLRVFRHDSWHSCIIRNDATDRCRPARLLGCRDTVVLPIKRGVTPPPPCPLNLLTTPVDLYFFFIFSAQRKVLFIDCLPPSVIGTRAARDQNCSSNSRNMRMRVRACVIPALFEARRQAAQLYPPPKKKLR